MQNLGKIWALFILTCGLVYGAGVKASVNTVEVVKGNPVQLFLKAKGGTAKFPKILMIGDYPVVGQSTNSSRNLSMVNGSLKSEQSTTKILQFIPQKDMTIPSYTVRIEGKEYTTDPIAIKVVKSSASTVGKNRLFSIEMKSTKTKVMVGESFMVTVYFSLKNGVRLSQDVQYTKPEFPGFSAVDIEEKHAYMKDNYQVQEIRYMLTAQKEGNFTSIPAQVRVGLPDRGRRDIFGMTFGTKWAQASSNSFEIEVLPQLQESDLVGEFSLQESVDTLEVKANKPVNLTVTIEGRGNLETFEFPKYEIDGVTVYSDEAKIQTNVVDGELHSSYRKSFAFISDRDFTIPPQKFSMLRGDGTGLKELHVNSYDIKIKAAKGIATTPKSEDTKGVVQTNMNRPTQSKEVLVEKAVEVKSVAWWMLIVAFTLGALSMFLVKELMKLKGKRTNPYREDGALKILYGHMSEDPEIEAMVRKLYAKKNGDKSVQIDKKALKEMVERFR
ncbi:MAG: BatD family protein [Campylobacterota bacterium]|nr:BatD family protein [Campylobacterota bacterium]